MRGLAVVAVAGVSLPVAQLDAQVIRGTVTLSDDGGPAGGAFVRLLDPSGAPLDGVLTNPLGRYSLSVRAGGPYRLRAEFIGREAAELELRNLDAGEIFEWSPALTPLPFVISGIDVEVEPRCRVRPEEGTAAAAVWDEARKALEVATWAQEQEWFRYELRSFRRELTPDRDRIVAEESERREGHFRRPFSSRPAPELVIRGFVQSTPDGTFAFAPDARVLLSDDFVDSHCFRLRRDEGRIGLVFEPTRDRRVTDVRGVMWLDDRTGALRSVAYEYVRFPEVGSDLGLGGRVDFERLPSGAWIVRAWSLEMPVLADVRRPGAEDLWDRRTVGIMEEGGEVLKVVDGEGRAVLAADRASLVGTVFDSIRHRPLVGATVRLEGTEHEARTGSDGGFVLSDLPGGRYRVHVTHPRLDSLDMTVEPVQANLTVGEATLATLVVPTTTPRDPGSAPRVRGEVLRPPGAGPLAGALVQLVDDAGTVQDADMTDERGGYVVEAPGSGRHRLRVAVVGRESVTSSVLELESGVDRFHSLVFQGHAVDLPDGEVVGPTPCRVEEPPDSPVARVWGEVRKALAMVDWAWGSDRLEYRVSLYERERADGDTIREDSTVVDGWVSHAFGEVPRDRDGRPRFVEHVIEGGESALVVAAPGPEFLASRWFAERYCRRLIPSPSGAGTVALAFEPAGGSEDAAVRGLFVLERATGVLRSMHYRYLRFPGPPRPEVPGGWMTFARVPGGPFFLAAWEERLPRTARVLDMNPGRPAATDEIGVVQVVRGGWVREAREAAGEVLWNGSREGAWLSNSPDRLWRVGAVLEAEVREVPTPVRLDSLTVSVEGRSPTLASAGFYERREGGQGVFLTRQMIERDESVTTSDLLRNLPGVRVVQYPRYPGFYVRSLVLRGGGSGCGPALWIDGVQRETGGGAPLPIDDHVDPADLEGVEVYRSAAEIPTAFSGPYAACGVLVIWTRQGR